MCYGIWLIFAGLQCSIACYDMQASSFLCRAEVSVFWFVEYGPAATVVLMEPIAQCSKLSFKHMPV